MREVVSEVTLNILSEDPCKLIVDGKRELVAVVDNESHKDNHSGNKVLFYLSSTEKFEWLLNNLRNGALNRSCCVQGNIITLKTSSLADYIADPVAVLEQARGLPVQVLSNEQAILCLIPTDIYDAMDACG
ncbi:MAG: hypothetical protein JKY67_11740 [Pseudomonadales bacterium]|nr:hypothetical protein [Pseudomonadales bacterium]